MTNIEIIKDIKNIQIPAGYKKVDSFPEKNTWHGRHVKIIAKADPSGWHQLGRVLLGLLICIPTLGFAALSQKVRSLFHTIGDSKFYGILLKKIPSGNKPVTDETQKIETSKVDSQEANDPKADTQKTEDKTEPTDEQADDKVIPPEDKPLLSSKTEIKQPIETTHFDGDSIQFLSTLTVSKDLNVKIPFLPFITTDENEQLIVQVALVGKSKGLITKEALKIYLDHEVLNLPLSDFFNKNSSVDKIFNTARRHNMQEIIKKRLEELEKEVQLHQRMEKLKLKLTVEDILQAWETSTLPFKLMLNEELSQLKISSLKNLNQPQIDELRKRVSALLLTSTILPGTGEFSDLQVMDVHKLKAKELNEHASEIPPVAFIFISEMVVDKLDITKLSSQQLECLFACDDLVKELNKDQVHLCLKRIENKALLSKLTLGQFKQIDLTSVDKEIFQALIGPVNTLAPYKIQSLSVEQIEYLHYFFLPSHWEMISDTQFEHLNFAKVMDFKDLIATSKMFSLMAGGVHTEQAKVRIRKLTLEKIYFLKDIINTKMTYWSHLSAKQFKEIDLAKVIDFNNIEDAYKIFSSMAGTAISYTAKEGIPLLSLDNIYLLKDIFNCYCYYWSLISDKQFEAIDFKKIIDDKDPKAGFITFNSFIGNSNSYEASVKFPKLSLERLYFLKNVINEDKHYWSLLSDKQFEDMDFEKIIDAKDPKAGIKTFKSIMGNYTSHEASVRFPKLLLKRLYFLKDVINEEKEYWSLLSVKQFEEVDFEKIIDAKDPKAGIKTFKSIMGNYTSHEASVRFPKLSLERLYFLKDIIKEDKDDRSLLALNNSKRLTLQK